MTFLYCFFCLVIGYLAGAFSVSGKIIEEIVTTPEKPKGWAEGPSQFVEPYRFTERFKDAKDIGDVIQ